METRDIPQRHDPYVRGFASDNNSGVHPALLAAISVANDGHQRAYGDDAWTEYVRELFRLHFGEQAEVLPVFGGTGANVVALQAATDRRGAVICAHTAHINTHEAGAAEHVGGVKVLPVHTVDGKLTPELIDQEAWGFDDPHRPNAQLVSITQSTELGTCYSANEIAAICAHAHDLGMYVHVDGARIANAAVNLGLPLAAFTTDVGVDIVSFGMTKNGAMLADAVVVLNPALSRGCEQIQLFTTQLPSKVRFISAQFEALLTGDLWLRNARHANQMAQRLARSVENLPGLEILFPVQANSVFAAIPAPAVEPLRERFAFYPWDYPKGSVRWVTSYDTTEEDVDAFAAAIVKELE